GSPGRDPCSLQVGGLGVEHVLEPVADEPPAPLDGHLLDRGEDAAVGGGVGQLPQLADHRPCLLHRGGFQFVLGVQHAAGHGGPPCEGGCPIIPDHPVRPATITTPPPN